MTPPRLAAAAAGALIAASLGSASLAGDVVADWSTAVAPPAPELKEVTVDPATTALLFLDIMKGGCTARPRCVAAVPSMKRLHDAARAHNMVVWYSLVGSNGKATPDDIMIVCGNSFQGATVGTASGAAQRGYNVIVPVDCSAGEDVYNEQYAAYHLAKGGPAVVTSKVTMTRSSMVKFGT